MADQVTGDNLRQQLEAALRERPACAHSHGALLRRDWACAECDVTAIWPLVSAAVSEAEKNGYLRGLHDAWHNTHIRRFDKDGGPWREGLSPGTVDTYYNGVKKSGYIIGDLWRAAGRTDPIGGDCYAEFPVTDLAARSVAAVDPEKEC